MDALQQRWDALKERIARAAERAGRDPAAITVVAVTKTRSAAEVEAALRCGLRAVGENRVQEAQEKRSLVSAPGAWHLIGHLQSNKAARAVGIFDLIQSVDEAGVARALDRRAAAAGRRLDVLLQVNTSGAEQQWGVAPEEVETLLGEVAGLPSLRVRGLMTIAAFSDSEAIVRPCFERLRLLRERLSAPPAGSGLDYLSMGMSGDFEWAIAEGANMLRLGTALFGPRQG